MASVFVANGFVRPRPAVIASRRGKRASIRSQDFAQRLIVQPDDMRLTLSIFALGPRLARRNVASVTKPKLKLPRQVSRLARSLSDGNSPRQNLPNLPEPLTRGDHDHSRDHQRY